MSTSIFSFLQKPPPRLPFLLPLPLLALIPLQASFPPIAPSATQPLNPLRLSRRPGPDRGQERGKKNSYVDSDSTSTQIRVVQWQGAGRIRRATREGWIDIGWIWRLAIGFGLDLGLGLGTWVWSGLDGRMNGQAPRKGDLKHPVRNQRQVRGERRRRETTQARMRKRDEDREESEAECAEAGDGPAKRAGKSEGGGWIDVVPKKK
ncbi:hypothetical protein CVT25_003134 [Psilocybe cyanescens]|uniref:Uncharacterized protein n=1 Tax=Psilocybe cyanescens TaxID=93625 RepID=A0A409XQM1_PSICY|nr:hypothetical protein CVT25_003134 [Psilocybe cyanescens]